MGDPSMLDWTNLAIGSGILITTITVLSIQLKKQTKATSATLSLEMLKRMREEDFRDVVEKILEDKPENCNSRDFNRVLNHFEYMALFENDGTLDIEHIIHMYGTVLQKIKTNPFIQKRIQEVVDKDPDYYYVHLRDLLKKIS